MGKGGPLNKKVHKVCKINLRFSSKKINNLYLLHFLSCNNSALLERQYFVLELLLCTLYCILATWNKT